MKGTAVDLDIESVVVSNSVDLEMVSTVDLGSLNVEDIVVSTSRGFSVNLGSTFRGNSVDVEDLRGTSVD